MRIIIVNNITDVDETLNDTIRMLNLTGHNVWVVNNSNFIWKFWKYNPTHICFISYGWVSLWVRFICWIKGWRWAAYYAPRLNWYIRWWLKNSSNLLVPHPVIEKEFLSQGYRNIKIWHGKNIVLNFYLMKIYEKETEGRDVHTTRLRDMIVERLKKLFIFEKFCYQNSKYDSDKAASEFKNALVPIRR